MRSFDTRWRVAARANRTPVLGTLSVLSDIISGFHVVIPAEVLPLRTSSPVSRSVLMIQIAWDGSFGASHRRHRHRRRRCVGLGPKTAARLLRFEQVCGRLREDPQRWAEIAYDCGYYDQPHMNREFRELAGITPTDFLARQLPERGTVGDGVTLLSPPQAKPLPRPGRGRGSPGPFREAERKGPAARGVSNPRR